MTPNLNEEERNIYDLIVNSGSRITQLQLARKAFVGCHERFEGYDTPKQSTLRKVRQLVNDLRMKHDLQILSDRKGYYIMRSKADAEVFIKELEITAKAQTKAYFERYRKMSRTLGIKSDYFEQQGKLFE
jgi:homoserine trans-succinylase